MDNFIFTYIYLTASAALSCVGLICLYYKDGNFKMVIFLKVLLIILLFLLPEIAFDEELSNKLETISLILILILDLIIGHFMRKKRRDNFKEKSEKSKDI